MYQSAYTKQFQRDVKRLKKRHKDFSKLKPVMQRLLMGEELDVSYKDHKLVGTYKGRRECHITPDWLLIYKLEGNVMIFERMGSHSDLF